MTAVRFPIVLVLATITACAAAAPAAPAVTAGIGAAEVVVILSSSTLAVGAHLSAGARRQEFISGMDGRYREALDDGAWRRQSNAPPDDDCAGHLARCVATAEAVAVWRHQRREVQDADWTRDACERCWLACEETGTWPSDIDDGVGRYGTLCDWWGWDYGQP